MCLTDQRIFYNKAKFFLPLFIYITRSSEQFLPDLIFSRDVFDGINNIIMEVETFDLYKAWAYNKVFWISYI